MSNPTRGLQRDITPRLGARLVQEGNRLHYLADRASITGKFSDIECRKLDETFPHFIRQMESMLTTGELSPTMPTASPCTTTVSPAKPTPLAVAATYTSPFTPLSVNYLHESKHENFTCNNSAGGEALPVTRGCLANVTDTSAGTALWSDNKRHAILQ
jgi:cytoskeleton bundling-enhancing protein CbeA-like protein